MKKGRSEGTKTIADILRESLPESDPYRLFYRPIAVPRPLPGERPERRVGEE